MTAADAKAAIKGLQPGRVVHFYDRTDGAPLAGTVAAVLDDKGTVNLSVTNSDGTTGPRLSVPYHDGGEGTVKSHSWRWPARG